MRAAIWLLGLFAVAVAAALFVGNNQGTVTVFWPPYRVDLSLNLVLLLGLAAFVLVHVALRTLAALFALPGQAQRWRMQYRERTIFSSLVEAQLHQYAGRFIRARKAAVTALDQEEALRGAGEPWIEAPRVQALGHILAAEASHALQDKATREEHLRLALLPAQSQGGQEVREGAQMRAVRWALDERDIPMALQHLDALPHGASRRTLALRMRLKAARLGGQARLALETARLLAKHRAFSSTAAQSLVRGLAQDLLGAAHDPEQLLSAWSQLDADERLQPDVALFAAQRLQGLGGDIVQALNWVMPVWERALERPDELGEVQRLKMIRVLQSGLKAAGIQESAAWLSRVESAQRSHPNDASLQYLAGMVCVYHQLWGKAQQLLEMAVPRLGEVSLKRQALQTLALLAERRGDAKAENAAYREAALL